MLTGGAGVREAQSQVSPGGWGAGGGPASSGSFEEMPAGSLTVESWQTSQTPFITSLGQLRIFSLCPPLNLHLSNRLTDSFGSRRKVAAEERGQEPGDAGGDQRSPLPCSGQRHTLSRSRVPLTQWAWRGTGGGMTLGGRALLWGDRNPRDPVRTQEGLRKEREGQQRRGQSADAPKGGEVKVKRQRLWGRRKGIRQDVSDLAALTGVSALKTLGPSRGPTQLPEPREGESFQ